MVVKKRPPKNQSGLTMTYQHRWWPARLNVLGLVWHEDNPSSSHRKDHEDIHGVILRILRFHRDRRVPSLPKFKLERSHLSVISSTVSIQAVSWVRWALMACRRFGASPSVPVTLINIRRDQECPYLTNWRQGTLPGIYGVMELLSTLVHIIIVSCPMTTTSHYSSQSKTNFTRAFFFYKMHLKM